MPRSQKKSLSHPSCRPGTVMDVFAGCGGLSSGLATTGLTPVLGVEMSHMAAATWAVNHLGDTAPVDTHHDAAAWAERPLPEQVAAGLVVRPVEDLLGDPAALDKVKQLAPQWLVGGPPCKGFSTAGRRDPNDQRNLLVFTMLDLAAELRPEYVVVENVLGMAKKLRGQTRPTFEVAAEDLAGHGYLVRPMRVESWRYGVPQTRPRLLLVGVRDDIAGATGVLPLFDDAAASLPLADGPVLTPTVSTPFTVRDAWWDLDANGEGYATSSSDARYATTVGAFARSMRTGAATVEHHRQPTHQPQVRERNLLLIAAAQAGLPDGLLRDAAVANDPSLLSPFDTLGTVDGVGKPGETLAEAAWRLRSKKRHQRVISPDAPAPTVMTLGDDAIHPWSTLGRRPTVREWARLQGFPDSFVFRGNEQTGGLARRFATPHYSQIGNAVPPLLGRAVGLGVQQWVASRGLEAAA